MFLASLAALATAGSAYAAFPGANGKLVFDDVGVCNPNCDIEIFSMNPDGTGLTNLTNSPSRYEGDPVWSPAGTKIAFTARVVGEDDSEIYVMNSDGTGVTQLTNNTNANDRWPTWSPDGTKIAFAKSVTPGLHDLYVMNADGTGETHLFDPAAFGSGPPLYPNWNSMGNRITFAGGPDIWVMAADGLSAGSLTDNQGYLDYARNPNFSPSGGKIVYSQEYECGDEISCGDIQIMNADGTGVTKVTDDYFSQNFPVWSPDGSRIAYQDDVDGLVLINPDGTNRTPIGPIFGRMDWQPLPGSSPPPPYPAPKLASPIKMALVPVFRQCGTGGNPTTGSHSPPLAVGSCNPQLQGVAHFGAQAQGTAWIATIYGDTNSANGDQADMTLRFDLGDIRTAAGADYDPSPTGADGTLVTRLRFTDRSNGPSGTDPGTATDFDFSVPFACTPTASTTVGSDCRLDTSADAVNPGMIKENKATVLQVFRLRLNDSGPNGIRGDSDDRLFASEGVFIP